MSAARVSTLALLAAMASPIACADLLALEDASVDPRLGSGGGGAADPATTAASSASAGGGDDVATASSSSAGAGGGDQATSSSAGGAADGGGGGAGGGGEPPLCEAYCGLVMESCTGAFAVYAALEVCLAVCAHLPEGTPGDTSGNTVHCRLHHAEAAPVEPSFYCPNAAIGGNGACGTSCEALCGVAEAVCTGDDAAWSSTSSCLEACAALPDLGTFSTDGAAAMYRGPHVQCRLFHLSAAAADDPEVHCMHVAGAPPCAEERAAVR